MFKQFLNLFSKIIDVVRDRRIKRQQDRITELRIKMKEAEDRTKYERAKGRASLHAQRAATAAGKHKNDEYRN